jgi:hypothetical protein
MTPRASLPTGDEAVAKVWTVVGMKEDWKTIYPQTGKEQAAAP